MNKNILILKGSPRTNGNSSFLADQLARGVNDSGGSTESFHLSEMDIHPCDACDFCQETDGVCVIKDDMQLLYTKIRKADAIVFASPIYWFMISAQTKLCIDRLYAFEVVKHEIWPDKRIGIILTYGDEDPFHSGAVNAIYTFESMFRYTKSEIVGIVYSTAQDIGDAAQQPELIEKAYQLGVELVQ